MVDYSRVKFYSRNRSLQFAPTSLGEVNMDYLNSGAELSTRVRQIGDWLDDRDVEIEEMAQQEAHKGLKGLATAACMGEWVFMLLFIVGVVLATLAGYAITGLTFNMSPESQLPLWLEWVFACLLPAYTLFLIWSFVARRIFLKARQAELKKDRLYVGAQLIMKAVSSYTAYYEKYHDWCVRVGCETVVPLDDFTRRYQAVVSAAKGALAQAINIFPLKASNSEDSLQKLEESLQQVTQTLEACSLVVSQIERENARAEDCQPN